MPLIAGNAGHCPGLDSGATGPNGLQEADVAKDITEKVLDFLSSVGWETKFIQENELQDICDISNEAKADFFVSIHCNSATSSEATGMEVFTTIGQTEADSIATFVMNQMQDSAPLSELPVRGDWVDGDVDKESNFYVLRNTDAPAILVEVAFISNPKEEAILADPTKRTLIAAAIARGVTDYWASKQ